MRRSALGQKAKYSLRADVFRCSSRHSSRHFESVALQDVDAGMMHHRGGVLRAARRQNAHAPIAPKAAFVDGIPFPNYHDDGCALLRLSFFSMLSIRSVEAFSAPSTP
jgi:hypothetical protein